MKWYHQNSNTMYTDDGRRVVFSGEIERYPMYRRNDIALVIEDYGNDRSAYMMTYADGNITRMVFEDATEAANSLFKLGFRE